MRKVAPLPGCCPAKVEVMQLDLESLHSVKQFAKQFNARQQPLHLLICNAGIMAPPERLTTTDGCEQQFQVRSQCFTWPQQCEVYAWSLLVALQ